MFLSQNILESHQSFELEFRTTGTAKDDSAVDCSSDSGEELKSNHRPDGVVDGSMVDL